MASIVIQTALPRAIQDPGRMDVAMFVGFVPLRRRPVPENATDEEGNTLSPDQRKIASLEAPPAVREALRKARWETRLEENEGQLRDLPVRVDSPSEFEALFAPRARVDRRARVAGELLPEEIEIDDETRIVAVELDGALRSFELPPGEIPVSDLPEALESGLGPGLTVDVVTDPSGGRSHLAVTRVDNRTAGSLTVYANRAIGFPVAARDEARLVGCPTGAAVRAFFAAGGRSCHVIRMGDPLPLVSTEADRVRQLGLLLTGTSAFTSEATRLDQLASFSIPPVAPAAAPQDDWRGLAHLHGLEDVTFVLMPDLPELLSSDPEPPGQPETPSGPPEIFTACVTEEPAAVPGAASLMEPPVCAQAGFEVWARTTAWLGQTLRSVSNELMGLLALPLPSESLRQDYPELLRQRLDGGEPELRSSRVQVVYPWIRSNLAEGLAGGVMPADGYLAGMIARSTLQRGAFVTVSGQGLPGISGIMPDRPGEFTYDAQPGRSITLIGHGPSGLRLESDVTLSDDLMFHQAGVRRLLAMIFRAARRRGETAAFEASGPGLWSDVQHSLTTILREVYAEGGLRGRSEAEAFQVTCDRSTMSQADIDAGRVIAEIGVSPAPSIETIVVTLASNRGGPLRLVGGSP